VRDISTFRVVPSARSTSIACDAFAVATVEHLLAAFAGLGVRSGCRVVLGGDDELPLLDGSAMAFTKRLLELDLPRSGSVLRVARAGRVTAGEAMYDFAPGDAVNVTAEVDLPASCERIATWNGEPATFMQVARARTFALEADIAELERLGVAQHVDPASVVVVSDDRLWGSGSVAPDEPARHKLLDLVGDAYLAGGPPLGSLRATRPGHARNHQAFAEARARGILEVV